MKLHPKLFWVPALLKFGVDGTDSLLDKVEESSCVKEALVGVREMLVGVERMLVEDVFMSASNSLSLLALQSGVSTCSTVFRLSTSMT